MIDILRQQNENLIKEYEKNNNYEELTKQRLIKGMLSDSKCFNKLTMDESYTLLKELCVNNDTLKDTYLRLMAESE